LAVTSDRDTGVQMLEGTTDLIADSARVAITLDASCSAQNVRLCAQASEWLAYLVAA
jgi:hypothetical protein